MKNVYENLNITSQYGLHTKEKPTNKVMQTSQLMKLFDDELNDIYQAEKALVNAIHMMIKNTTSPELIDALTNHLTETEFHITRLEVFDSIDRKATANKCQAMEDMIKEAYEIIEFYEAGVMRDAEIISVTQKVKNYEITSYEILLQRAETLGLADAVSLLGDTLDEEKSAEEKFAKVVQSITVKTAEKDTMVATKSKRKLVY